MSQLDAPTIQGLALRAFQSSDSFQHTGVFKDSAGAAVDLSAWDRINLRAITSASNEILSDGSAIPRPVGQADGTIVVHMNGVLANAAVPGTYPCYLEGRVTSGDEFQCLFAGQINIAR